MALALRKVKTFVLAQHMPGPRNVTLGYEKPGMKDVADVADVKECIARDTGFSAVLTRGNLYFGKLLPAGLPMELEARYSTLVKPENLLTDERVASIEDGSYVVIQSPDQEEVLTAAAAAAAAAAMTRSADGQQGIRLGMLALASGGGGGGPMAAPLGSASAWRSSDARLSRVKFVRSSSGSGSPAAKLPSLYEGSGRKFFLDGPLFAQGQATAKLHLCADASSPTDFLCAKVYEASDDGRAAAAREIAAGREIAAQFPEAATLVRFCHTGALPSGSPIIIMPFYFFSLADLIHTFFYPTKSLPAAGPGIWVRSIAQVALGVCAAVAKLHAMGRAHCDVKPSNIMLRPDGVPVLVDLAAVTVLGNKPVEVSDGWIVTKTAEEKAVLKASASPALDLHCLAATVYSCLIGAKSSDTAEQLAVRGWASVDEQPIEESIAYTCWDYACRRRSAAELLERLCKIIGDASVLTPDEIEACLA